MIGNEDDAPKTLKYYVVVVFIVCLTHVMYLLGVITLREGTRMVLATKHINTDDDTIITLSFTSLYKNQNSIGYCNRTFFTFSFWTFVTFSSAIVSLLIFTILFVVFKSIMECCGPDYEVPVENEASEDYVSDELKSSVKYKKLEI